MADKNLDSLILAELVGLVEQSISRLRRSERGKKAIEPGEADIIQTQLDMLRRLADIPTAKVEEPPVVAKVRSRKAAVEVAPAVATAESDLELEMAKAEAEMSDLDSELEGL